MRMGMMGVLVLSVLTPCVAWGGLQNVQVGGKIEIYGAWYSEVFEPTWEGTRIPDLFLRYRAIGLDGTLSAYRFGRGGNELAFVEQRTRLHLSADFTEEVMAFIEFDSIDTWGEDFRSDYVTGLDSRADTSDDVEVYQAYIEGQSVFGVPIAFRVGRQEMEFGSGWLVGADPGPDPFVGMSFDAVRLTYSADALSVDVWWAKLAEQSPWEQDGDTDFYGVYATYALEDGAAEGVEFDAYWMFLRDAAKRNDTDRAWLGEWIEDLVGYDDYGVTELHTVGLRNVGAWNALDWEVEAAYQWGDASAVGSLFVPVDLVYGDDAADWDLWAGHAEVGYTFDVAWSPRLYLGGAYYQGKDNRDLTFWEWFFPFQKPDASVSFNRLFSSKCEDACLLSTNMSNFWKVYLGATATPTDALEIGVDVGYFETVAPFDNPVAIRHGSFWYPFLADRFPFITKENADDLFWQTFLYVYYQFSEDLGFEVGWAHCFTGDAISDRVAFLDGYGLTNVGGIGEADVDYVYFYTSLEF